MYLQLLFMFGTFASVTAVRTSVAQRDGASYTCYYCVGEECDNPYNKTCKDAYGCFTSLQVVEEKYLLYQKGCYRNYFVKLSFCDFKSVNLYPSNCCVGNLCNVDEFPDIPDHWTPPPEVENEQLNTTEINSACMVPVYVLPVSIISTIFVMIVIFLCVLYISKRNSIKSLNFPRFLKHRLSSVNSILASDRSSMPILNQRYMDHDVTLIKCIGQGRYGEVWQGMWHGENVAVKIFPTRDEASWKNEVNIYTNIALYHENVLGFKGSVVTARLDTTELWLFTAFHEQGSLYDYLLENTVTCTEIMNFVRSICSGLLHLHAEVFGTKGKPAIAHRDLKTRNILLTSHGTCVIADFGLAVVKTKEFPKTDTPINYRVGTKRYMAPEILDDSIEIDSFESFKRADIYAFGLILWEVCSRYSTNGTAEAYCPPFHDSVPNNPEFEDMKKVVCIESKRPEIPESWSSNKALNDMATLMKECWHKNPGVRPTVCRIKKMLDKINVDIQNCN